MIKHNLSEIFLKNRTVTYLPGQEIFSSPKGRKKKARPDGMGETKSGEAKKRHIIEEM